jgi:hypothetical protein
MRGQITGEVKAAKVYFGEDRILRVEIDLNHSSEDAVESRVGAYGTLEYAREVAAKWFMVKEMQHAQAQMQRKPGVIMPGGPVPPTVH